WLLVVVAVSVLSTGAGWWARLTPQIWWVPIMSALAIRLAPERTSLSRHLSNAILLVLLAPAVATAVISAGDHVADARQYPALRRELMGHVVAVWPATGDPNGE